MGTLRTMKATITDVIETNSVETKVKVKLENGETFISSFDKNIFMARHSGFKHRYGCYPENAVGVEVSAQPPNSTHSGKIDILAN